MLYPFWGKNPEDPGNSNSGRFDRYAELGQSFFRMTSLAEADIAVLPAPWEDVLSDRKMRQQALQFTEQAKDSGKPTIVFFWSDSAEDVPLGNAVVFRTSLYRSRRKPNEFAMPAWSEDFVEKHLGSQLPLRAKREKPIVGFCGNAGPRQTSFKQRVKGVFGRGANLLGMRKSTIAPAIRARALNVLLASPLVETNFIIRDRFLGGALRPDQSIDLGTMQKVRREYVENMVESDYILCARGSGNFSYRLYETLSCGRIPVFIDTDCVLPYDFDIDWRKYLVWVEERELSTVAEKVAEFHAGLSPQDFLDLQLACRKLWEEKISPVGFFANFYRHFGKAAA